MKKELTLSNTIKHVENFHNAFGINNEDSPIANVGDKTIDLRYELMREENEEYLEAAKNNDLTEIADALGDQLYILCGTILSHGLQHKIAEVFEEIQRSNMSKLGEDGKPKCKNFCKIKDNYLKYEPVFVFYKKGK